MTAYIIFKRVNSRYNEQWTTAWDWLINFHSHHLVGAQDDIFSLCVVTVALLHRWCLDGSRVDGCLETSQQQADTHGGTGGIRGLVVIISAKTKYLCSDEKETAVHPRKLTWNLKTMVSRKKESPFHGVYFQVLCKTFGWVNVSCFVFHQKGLHQTSVPKQGKHQSLYDPAEQWCWLVQRYLQWYYVCFQRRMWNLRWETHWESNTVLILTWMGSVRYQTSFPINWINILLYIYIEREIDTHLSTQMFDHKNSKSNLEGNALWLSTFPEKDAMRLLKMDFRNESRGGCPVTFCLRYLKGTIKMELKNQPMQKDNYLPKLHFWHPC